MSEIIKYDNGLNIKTTGWEDALKALPDFANRFRGPYFFFGGITQIDISKMKLTWTFYPKFEPKITLSISYLPKVDKTGEWGFLHVESNQAWVSWDCFKVFDRGDMKAKKDAFSRLIKINSLEELNSNNFLTS